MTNSKVEDTYYYWTFELETGTIEVSEMDVSYRGEPLEEVEVFINRLGVSRFFMYSKYNDKKGEKKFLKGITEILYSDMSATERMHNLALGRFNQFNNFLKGREREGK